jgi:hypothetical protein
MIAGFKRWTSVRCRPPAARLSAALTRSTTAQLCRRNETTGGIAAFIELIQFTVWSSRAQRRERYSPSAGEIRATAR